MDARLPVRFGALASRAPDEAVLTDAAVLPNDLALPGASAAFAVGTVGHALDCACCTPRSGAATALAGLFRARAVGTGVPFRGVLAVVGPAGETAVRSALAEDAVVSGRYRLV